MKKLAEKFWVVLISAGLFFLIGCASTNPEPYSFVPGEPSASIEFLSETKRGQASVSFISFEGRGLPRAERKTRWDPISFPSDENLRIIVRVKFDGNARVRVGGFGLIGAVANAAADISAMSRNVDLEMVFECPPLRNGRRYQLSFTKEPGIPGRNILTLTDLESNRVMHQVEFETVPGGYNLR